MTSTTIGTSAAPDFMPQAATRSKPTPRALARALAAELGVTWDEILGRQRHREIVRARQISQWIILCESRLSLPQIGRLFNRDHTTILHTRRIMSERIADDDGFAASIEDFYLRALERWREAPKPAPATSIRLAPKRKPAAPSPATVLPPSRNTNDEVCQEHQAVRLATEGLLAVLRTHHPDKEITKNP